MLMLFEMYVGDEGCFVYLFLDFARRGVGLLEVPYPYRLRVGTVRAILIQPVSLLFPPQLTLHKNRPAAPP
jgi:hypothetical protein